MKEYVKFLRKRGFTLVELIVIIAIVGILSTAVTASVISIVQSTTEKNNKTATRNYFALSKTSLNQINSGTSIYSNGTFTTNADISMVIKRTTGTEPTSVIRLEDAQAVDKVRPFATDTEGYYVAIRFADPNFSYPVSSSTAIEESNREFFVEAVYFVSKKICYAYTRYSKDVKVYK